MLSEVAEPPAQMIDSLTQLFSKYKQVKRAFVASIREHADEQANLLIGIEADSDIETIIQAAGSVASDTLLDDAPIDICEVTAEDRGISHFFTAHITPFMNAAGEASCASSKAVSVLSDNARPLWPRVSLFRNRQIVPAAPFAPGTVIERDIPDTQRRQRQNQHDCGHA